MDETKATQNLSVEEQLQLQQEALAKIYKSVEQTRKIMLWTGVANLALFILPAIAAILLLPTIMNTFSSSLGGLSQTSAYQQESATMPSLSESLQNLKDLGY